MLEAPSWRSIAIQALVICLIAFFAYTKAVASETLATALGVVVTSIFMGQTQRTALHAVSTANNNTGTSGGFPAVRPPPGPGERVTVQMEETREPATTRSPTNPGRDPRREPPERQRGPGHLRVALGTAADVVAWVERRTELAMVLMVAACVMAYFVALGARGALAALVP